jgi:hypothetical protein
MMHSKMQRNIEIFKVKLIFIIMITLLIDRKKFVDIVNINNLQLLSYLVFF